VRRPGWLLLLCMLSPLLAAEQQCETLFSDGDRALFRFVQTRGKVDFNQYRGLTLGEIRVVVLPVFDIDNPEEDLWLYRTANRIHVSTRHSTVRRQLTLRTGAVLDPARVEENERRLRDKSYFADAMILPAQVCADRIDLLVVVRDVWTLTPIASASRQGGEDTASGGFSYDNAFGSGHNISVAWSTDPERDSIATWWSATDLFGHHISMTAAYVDSTDGDLRLVDAQRPFYQLNSRWSGGGRWQRQRYEEDIELLDVVLNEYGHETDYDEVFGGWSAGVRNGRVQRWRIGMTDRQERFYATDPASVLPADERLVYPWLSVESLSDQFWRATNISFSHRQEDIPLGWRWNLSAGLADRGFQSSEDALLFAAGSSLTRRSGDRHLGRISVSTQGRWRQDDDELVGTFATFEARYYYFISRRDRWFASLRAEAARGIREDEQFSSGGSDILRGYPLYTQRGDRRWVMTVERRHFTDWHPFNLIRIGGAAYLDAGRTWDSSDNLDQSQATLINAGIGLRFSSSKSRADRVLHVDYAVPLVARDEVDDHQIVIVGKLEF
jgi:outer membrane protein assembly factor BamA